MPKKIVKAAAEIAAGKRETLTLGNMQIARDWGYAPEYVEATWLMLQRETPQDFVIATGQSHALEDFTAAVFAEFGLDWRKHVRSDTNLFRPNELQQRNCGESRSGAGLATTYSTGGTRTLARRG